MIAVSIAIHGPQYNTVIIVCTVRMKTVAALQ